jgi:hypothetical protein
LLQTMEGLRHTFNLAKAPITTQTLIILPDRLVVLSADLVDYQHYC